MKFIHLTDTHIRESFETGSMEAVYSRLPSPSERLRKTLTGICWEGTSFVIVTGDLIHEGTVGDYRIMKEIVRETVPETVPVHYVLGNHDVKENFYRGILEKEESGFYYYSTELDGYRLIVLDSAIPGKESGMLPGEELDWLKEKLSVPSEKGTLVFMHHPAFWLSAQGFPVELTNSAEATDVLMSGDVLAVFCGHTHQNAVNVQNGLVQFTADSLAFSIEMNEKRKFALRTREATALWRLRTAISW